MNFFVGNYFINQKAHPKSEKEGDEVFDDESKDRCHIQKGAKAVTLNNGNHGGEDHTDEEKSSRQKNHEKIKGLSAKDVPSFLNLKDNIEGCPQRTEYPGGGPHQSPYT